MEKTYVTDRLILRTLSTIEGQMSLDYYRDNRKFLSAYEPDRDESFYTLDHHQRLVAAEQVEMDQLRMLRLWIFLKDSTMTRPIGNFAFTNIIRGVFLSCFLGYKLDQAHLRQGYMTEALTKGIEIMFQEYGLHRIEANILPYNQPSLALTEKLGFYNEGTAKKYLRINGVWQDHIHMVLRNTVMENVHTTRHS